MEKKLETLQRELLKHKYLYYECFNPEISDPHYDRLEKDAMHLAEELGHDPEDPKFVHNMVGFDRDHEWSKEIMQKNKHRKLV